ncbi:MAG: histidinol-phosphate aminotransferase family protein [Chloroflexi bacterium]|nr:histidinol-phosphate aminotransferase family protein [Chloroflexota bacterium]
MAAESPHAPVASQVYTWEPSNAAIASRYGLAPEQILRFDTNTSPAPPDFLDEILRGSFDPPLNEYPDSAYTELTRAAADYVGVPPDRIVVGAGADEVLDLIAKAFLPAGSAALVPVPTYSMYGVLTGQRAARVAAVPRLGPDEGYALDLDRVQAAVDKVRVVWLCAPNNPTGADEPPGTVEQVLELAAHAADPPIVVVDEAYHEFTGRTVVPLCAHYLNLVAVRTLSKAFALAGIRVGYAVAARETIARLERVRPPGSISTISARLATVALRHAEAARARVASIIAERDRLARGLRDAGWKPLPSVTNFLLVRIGDHATAADHATGEAAAERLLRRGIVPRTFGPANPLRGHLRLTVRSAEENARLLAAVAS